MKLLLPIFSCFLIFCASAQIGTIRELDEINVVGESEAYSCLLNDGLTLYFVNNGTGQNNLYVSTRASVNDQWGTKQLVDANLFVNVVSFWVSEDELTVHFFASGAFYRTMRSSTNDPFQSAVEIALEGYATPAFMYGPSITQNGQELFVGAANDAPAMYDTYCRFVYEDDTTFTFADTLVTPSGYEAKGGQIIRDDVHAITSMTDLVTDSVFLFRWSRSAEGTGFENPVKLDVAINSSTISQAQPAYDINSDMLVWTRNDNGLWGGNQLFEVSLGILSVLEMGSVDSQVSVYPNPATSALHITSEAIQIAEIELADQQGRVVQIPIEKNFSDGFMLDVATLPSGIYFVRIITSNGFLVKTFTKS